MIKTEIRFWLAHGPSFSEFLIHLEQEFDIVYFYMKVLVEVFFNLLFESLKSDKK